MHVTDMERMAYIQVKYPVHFGPAIKCEGGHAIRVYKRGNAANTIASLNHKCRFYRHNSTSYYGDDWTS